MSYAMTLDRSSTATWPHASPAAVGYQWDQPPLTTTIRSTPPGAAVGSDWPTGRTPTPEPARELQRVFTGAWAEGWELVTAGELVPPNVRIWAFALWWTLHYADMVSSPIVCPLQHGGVSVEWHAHGLNIEIRFRSDNHVFVVVEDARGELSTFHGRDNTVSRAANALRVLRQRSASADR